MSRYPRRPGLGDRLPGGSLLLDDNDDPLAELDDDDGEPSREVIAALLDKAKATPAHGELKIKQRIDPGLLPITTRLCALRAGVRLVQGEMH